MVLAAGLGTRLRPLTNDRPKALVEVNGRTLLEITLARLRRFGVHDVIINTHHFADGLIRYLEDHRNFGMRIEISREDEVLLDTGGGLKKAAEFFLRDSGDTPFVLHNVDVLSTIDLHEMVAMHRKHDALATLAMRDRSSSRLLLFNAHSELCGRQVTTNNTPTREMVHACPDPHPLAFCGIHVISPRLLRLMQEQGVFSVIDVYLRLSGAGETIRAFRADNYYWRDLGRPEDLARAAADVANGALVLS